MLDKTEYYHGAAIVRLLENENCTSVKKQGLPGYVVNNEVFVFLKYSTKGRTPWGFSFDLEDLNRCLNALVSYRKVVVGLICGGDGVCALDWQEVNRLLDGKPGRIAAGRKHNHSYSVWGSAGELKYKIPVNHWPLIAFEVPIQTA
ncbi:MAG: hypothetical protein P4L74_06765 [Candidatus Doudnabacteria bacterium]|nr:hypothetical protein [Candidatus Doudnabacteria bacterium]